MKKISLLLALFLSSCSLFQNYQGTESNDIDNENTQTDLSPTENADTDDDQISSKSAKDTAIHVSNRTVSLNEKCEDFPAVKIFQVLDDFSLGFACKTFDAKDLFCLGFTVYIPKENGKIYYDDQIIKPSAGKCFVFNDTYRYETRNGTLKTIPVISFENKTIETEK